MPSTVFEKKKDLRKKTLEVRRSLSKDEILSRSLFIQNNIINSVLWSKATSVALYMSTDDEISTNELILSARKFNKTIYIPLVHPTAKRLMVFVRYDESLKLKSGPFGIKEPDLSSIGLSLDIIDQKNISVSTALPLKSASNNPFPLFITPESLENYPDLFIVPGLAFDLQGRRLGYGGGYFDAYLKNVNEADEIKNSGCTTIGVCFAWQIVNTVPTEEWDMRVSNISNDKEFLGIKK